MLNPIPRHFNLAHHSRSPVLPFFSIEQSIESKLDISLNLSGAPDELPEALADGISLCHLINALKPGTITHVCYFGSFGVCHVDSELTNV